SRRYMKRFLPVAMAVLTFSAARTNADVPRTIAFQGVLKDAAGKPVTGPVGGTSVTFSLYANQNGTTPAWTETQTVNATDGLFAVPLGSLTSFASAGIVFDKLYWVGVKIGSDAEMLPRTPLQSVPYALALPQVVVSTSGNVGIGTASP